MSGTFTHPQLGELEFDIDLWQGEIALPSFAVYTEAASPYNDDDATPGRYELQIHCGDDDVPPTDAQVAAALSLIEHEKALAAALPDALWADFMGEGPATGMWWHGDLAQVNEMMGCQENLETRDQLARHFSLQSVGVGYQHETAVELMLSTTWEEEHGVGVLVDNGKIIGIGYSLDVQPYDA